MKIYLHHKDEPCFHPNSFSVSQAKPPKKIEKFIPLYGVPMSGRDKHHQRAGCNNLSSLDWAGYTPDALCYCGPQTKGFCGVRCRRKAVFWCVRIE